MKYFSLTFFAFAILFYSWLLFVEGLEILTERPEILYYNKKYIRDLKVNVSKKSRRSPYYFNIQGEALDGAGDNVTFKFILYEHISGRYIMTPIHFEYKLCDFLRNEPYLGHMWAKQLPKNWTCPFSPGWYQIKDFVVHLEKFPYNLPFVYSSYKVDTRADLTAKFTTTNEPLLSAQAQLSIIQKAG